MCLKHFSLWCQRRAQPKLNIRYSDVSSEVYYTFNVVLLQSMYVLLCLYASEYPLSFNTQDVFVTYLIYSFRYASIMIFFTLPQMIESIYYLLNIGASIFTNKQVLFFSLTVQQVDFLNIMKCRNPHCTLNLGVPECISDRRK